MLTHVNDGGNPGAGLKVDIMLHVPVLLMNMNYLHCLLSLSKVLREQGPVVWELGLIVDEDDVVGRAFGTKCLRCFGPGKPSTHDDECRRCHLSAGEDRRGRLPD